MPLEPDPRWANFIGGITPSGLVRPLSLESLQDIAADLAGLVDGVDSCGSTELLQTALWLLVTSWFHYELLAVAALVGYQAVEAVFRERVYPDARVSEPFRALIKRAERDGVVLEPYVGILDAGVELRNRLSHPGGQAAFTLAMVKPMLETSHLFVRDLS